MIKNLKRSIYVNIKQFFLQFGYIRDIKTCLWLYLTCRKAYVLTVATWSCCHGHTEKIKMAFYSLYQGLTWEMTKIKSFQHRIYYKRLVSKPPNKKCRNACFRGVAMVHNRNSKDCFDFFHLNKHQNANHGLHGYAIGSKK